ncbi:MAG: hypothetical protein NTW69_02205 [Chloroflexi bacterium]|nr:hypothetical protein [Chloroflexota bacterium]
MKNKNNLTKANSKEYLVHVELRQYFDRSDLLLAPRNMVIKEENAGVLAYTPARRVIQKNRLNYERESSKIYLYMEILSKNKVFIPYIGVIMSNGVSRIRQRPLTFLCGVYARTPGCFLTNFDKIESAQKNDPHP